MRVRVSEGETGTGSGRTGVEVQWTAKVRLVLDASGSLPGATELPAARRPQRHGPHPERGQVWANANSE